MLHRFKNLDRKQKREFYRLIGWSGSSLTGGVVGARQIGADIADIVVGWVVGLLIVFITFRVLRIFKIA